MALAAQIRRGTLQATHHLASIVIDDGGIFGIALIGPAPAIILGTATVGAKVQSSPVAATSRAVTWPIR